jgi:hypothetical protein
VSEKSVVMKENYWTVVLVVVHRVFYSHLKKYDMVAKTFCTVAAVENSDTLKRQTFSFVNGIESDVSQNVTQTLSTLISLAMAFILTPSLCQTHFCKSDIAAFQMLRAILTYMSNTDTDFIILDENPVYANQISDFIQSV